MTFPATGILATFQGANDPTPIAGFANILDGLEIVSAEAVGSDTGDHNISHWTASQFSANQEAYVTLNSWGVDYVAGLVIKIHDVSGANFNGYWLVVTNTSNLAVLLSVVAGTPVLIGSISIAFDEGDGVGLRSIGSTVELWRQSVGDDWAQVGGWVDATYENVGGYIAPYTIDAGLINFGGGNYLTPGEQAALNRTPTPRGTHQSLLLPVLVSDPLWWTDRRGYITTLYREISGDSFTVTDGIGYDRSTLPLKLNRSEADDWLLDGLGRHTVRKNESGVTIWEGFVNLIRYRYGGSSRTIGPLIEMANVVDGVYSPQDTTTTPPTSGGRTSTGYYEDEDSKERYGEIRQILSLGTTTDSLATRAVSKFLSEKRFPPRTTGESFPGGSDMELTLECLGYGHLFSTYEYNDTGTGEQNLSTQLVQILNACPFASIFAGDSTRIEINTLQVPLYVDGSPRAKALIEELVSYGDEDDNRYIFGVFAGRQIIYELAPTATYYIRRVSDRKQEVEDRAGGRVWPWNVLPGKWLRTPDLLPGRSQPANLREDIRNTYIVSVSFSSPDRLEVSGDAMEELPQMLAKIQRGVNFA